MRELAQHTARRVLVIGTAAHSSRPILDQALAGDAMVIVIEGDAARAEEAKRHIRAAGLANRATVIAGDPRRVLYKMAGPFDAIFCPDSDPSIREKLERLLAPEGVLITNDTAS